jgi:hypothetical protein
VQAGDARDACCLSGRIGAHRHAAVYAGEAGGKPRRVGVESVTRMLGMKEWERRHRHAGIVGMSDCTLDANKL